MGLVILGVNTVYVAFCFIRTLAIVGKGLSNLCLQLGVSLLKRFFQVGH